MVTALPPLSQTLVDVALLTGLRRAELFALRWRNLDDVARTLIVDEAVYEGTFATPKTAAGVRRVPLSDAAWELLEQWRPRATSRESDALVFATRSGKPIAPNNVLRRWVFPACDRLRLRRATRLTFRRTYSSWAHDKGVPGNVVAQLMGLANVDTTLKVYTQVVDGAVRRAVTAIGEELFTIVHGRGEGEEPTVRICSEKWLAALDDFRNWLQLGLPARERA